MTPYYTAGCAAVSGGAYYRGYTSSRRSCCCQSTYFSSPCSDSIELRLAQCAPSGFLNLDYLSQHQELSIRLFHRHSCQGRNRLTSRIIHPESPGSLRSRHCTENPSSHLRLKSCRYRSCQTVNSCSHSSFRLAVIGHEGRLFCSSLLAALQTLSAYNLTCYRQISLCLSAQSLFRSTDCCSGGRQAHPDSSLESD